MKRDRNILRISMGIATAIYVGGNVIVASAAIDRNDNGISDIWEARYHMEDPSSTGDADGDGQSDWEEALNATDPTDAQSKFSLTVDSDARDGWFVTWRSKPGIRYFVQADDGDGVWRNLSGLIDGTDGIVGFSDGTGAPPTRLYRIVVAGDEEDVPTEFRAALSGMDTDGDGQDDWTEWMAGTSIVDPEESFGIEEIRPARTITIKWWGVDGMKYALEAYSEGTWRPLAVFEGANRIMEFTTERGSGMELFRVVSSEPDSDSDGLADWEERMAGLDPFHKCSRDVERSDLEVIAQELWNGGKVSLVADGPTLSDSGVREAGIRLVRTNGFAAISVPLTISGDAVAGEDYDPLPDVVQVPFGESEVMVPLRLAPDASIDSTKSIIVELGDSAEFECGERAVQSVTLLHENFLDVTDFGALGDGVADDGPAIQRAIDSMENSSEYNGLYFPAGTYRLAHAFGDNSAPTGSRRLLKMGRDVDLAGRDIVFAGADGATLYSDLESLRANMLVCTASFRSLTFRNLRFEQSPSPLSPLPGSEPNGSDAVTILPKEFRSVEKIEFDHCDFVNCHRSVSIYGRGYDTQGLCGLARFVDCRFLNPYGANTISSEQSWGGGQQVYIASWVDFAVYERNVFEGGGADMTDSTTSPGGRLKDGGHFGAPQHLVFRGNRVSRMGVEALFQINDNTFMGGTRSSFTVPPADDATEVQVEVSPAPSTYHAGEIVVIRTALSPGQSPSNLFLRIQDYDADNDLVTFTNPGLSPASDVGAEIQAGRMIYLDDRAEATRALIENNIFDGALPPGGVAFPYVSGICFDAQSVVRRNFVKGYPRGIYSPSEVRTPRHPASKGSVVEKNLVFTIDPRNSGPVVVMGIWQSGGHEKISQNLIYVPICKKVCGIVPRGEGASISGNTVVAMIPQDNGYSNSLRGVGIGMGNTSSKTHARANFTRGFDVGIGPERPFQAPTYYLNGHFSVNDVLPIDRRGLISE